MSVHGDATPKLLITGASSSVLILCGDDTQFEVTVDFLIIVKECLWEGHMQYEI